MWFVSESYIRAYGMVIHTPNVMYAMLSAVINRIFPTAGVSPVGDPKDYLEPVWIYSAISFWPVFGMLVYRHKGGWSNQCDKTP